jgi:endonuclease/exonuclease/phosphatase family metal-dependent hydrolase
MAYNIHHGEGTDGKFDLGRIAKLITDQKPDLVAVQEVDVKTRRAGGTDQAAELARLTGMHYAFGEFMEYSGGRYGQMVLSRYPILSHENFKLPDGPEPRAALIVKTKPPGFSTPLLFVGNHLYGSAEQRLSQAKALIRKLGGESAPAILAGDFNSTPQSPTMKALRGDGGWTDPTHGARGGETFPSDAPRIEIDYILFRPPSVFTFVSSKVIGERVASDHRPVLTVLEVGRDARAD